MPDRFARALAPWFALTLTSLAPIPSSAAPPSEPGSHVEGGFSLERGAWLQTPHAEIGIGVLAQLRYGATIFGVGRAPVTNDRVDSLGFTLPFLRPNLHGSAFDGKLRFFFQPEFAVTPKLLDAQVIYQPIAAFGLDLGQYRPHLSRAWNTPIPLLSMPGRGVVDDAFHHDRALGATVFGRPLAGKLEYDVGLFNAGGFNVAQPIRLEPLVTWRLAINPLGPVPLGQTPAFAQLDHTVFGLAAHGWTDRFEAEQVDPAVKPTDHRRVTAGGEFVVMTPRVHLLVEGFGRWRVNHVGLADAGWGGQAQAGAMLVDQTLELQARAGVIDNGIGIATQGVWEGGLCWYLLGHHLRAQLHYGCTQTLDTPGCASHRAQLQTQLWF